MVFIIVLVAEAQAQVINYESRGPAPRAEVATGLTSASAMEAPSPDDRDFIMEVDDLIVLVRSRPSSSIYYACYLIHTS